MPVAVYSDDIVITGSTDIAKLIASLYSVTYHGFQAQLGGDPLMFRPINISDEQLYEYYDTYHTCVSIVELILGQSALFSVVVPTAGL